MDTPFLPEQPTELQTLLHGDGFAHLSELDTLLREPEFAGQSPATALERDQRTYRRLAVVGRFEGGAKALVADTERLTAAQAWMAVADPSLFHAALVHFSVCTWSILTLGRPEGYLDELTEELDCQRAAGTIMITELGRSNSHICPGTEAHFDPESRSFTLHTPDPASAKIMANVAADGVANTSIVYAQLIVEGRKCGVFPFAIRVRTVEGPCAGIRISALSEVPSIPLDYALVSFHGARVAYDGWLRDEAFINADGQFVDPLESPSHRLVRSLAFNAHAALGAAVGLAAAARASVTIAMRYANQRITSGTLAPGLGVLGYSTQQLALYSALAEVYATTFLVEQAKTWYREGNPAGARTAKPTWAPWTAVHRGLALTKAAATSCLARVTNTARASSGAQGLLSANRLTEYEGAAQVYHAAVGDNLLTRLDAGKNLTQDNSFHPNADLPDSLDDCSDPETVLALAAVKEAVLLSELREHVAQASPGATEFEVWNPVMPKALQLADAHTRTLALRAFEGAVVNAQDELTREQLRSVQILHGLTILEEDLSWHLERGTLSREDATQIHTARTQAVAKVHEHAAALVDAFAIPTTRLHAPMAENDYIDAMTPELHRP
ncbi:acyl-CoA oxidase [Streptomyces sp. V4I23]|uniref:acyl-CoA dehydrogenase n=1 Tax=Streptomyces sp. V4I23 TaxID=3042282 RepID=UPI00278149AF|nr:acyl-CoA dehydrogenase [Streptomyces sp. V4I23]MDQ1005524.1 acyl-CoA oxidase [Streptomyces sp. V4I23]